MRHPRSLSFRLTLLSSNARELNSPSFLLPSIRPMVHPKFFSFRFQPIHPINELCVWPIPSPSGIGLFVPSAKRSE